MYRCVCVLLVSFSKQTILCGFSCWVCVHSHGPSRMEVSAAVCTDALDRSIFFPLCKRCVAAFVTNLCMTMKHVSIISIYIYMIAGRSSCSRNWYVSFIDFVKQFLVPQFVPQFVNHLFFHTLFSHEFVKQFVHGFRSLFSLPKSVS